jgi:ABC-type glycerol-3-phosphate transport system substrate-binding protein
VKDAAWEFVKWMCDDMQQSVVDGLGFFSVLKDAPAMTTETTEAYQKAYDAIVAIIASGNTVGFREALYPEMGDALYDNLQLLATGGTTPEEATLAMDTACEALK